MDGMLSFVRAELAQLGPANFRDLADETEVPESTIRKIHYGETSDPRIGSVEPLYHYFKRRQGKQAKRTAQ